MSGWEFNHKYLEDKKDPRVEIRKKFSFSTFEPGMAHGKYVNFFAQVLVVVRPEDNKQGIPEVVMSMNGKSALKSSDLFDMVEAIGEAREALQKDKPYLESMRVVRDREYNPEYGDDRTCECGHSYYRHFDSYEDMYPCGCKYCGCFTFKEAKQ